RSGDQYSGGEWTLSSAHRRDPTSGCPDRLAQYLEPDGDHAPGDPNTRSGFAWPHGIPYRGVKLPRLSAPSNLRCEANLPRVGPSAISCLGLRRAIALSRDPGG